MTGHSIPPDVGTRRPENPIPAINIIAKRILIKPTASLKENGLIIPPCT
jgi:hypothetical protein